jgi:spermidine synthase
MVACVYGLALLSGVASLIYEITWAKMLALTFGSTTLSAAAVIAAFMGGMGLGARSYDFVYRRTRRPLLLYGCLEIGIAISTALLTRTFYSLPQFFADLSSVVPPGPCLGLTRFALVFVLLLIPSALMGATFPALCTIMIRSVQGVDRHLGMIYGINTIGGAGGVLLAGLILVERLGLTGSVNAANVINLAVGCAALALVRTAIGRGDGRSARPGQTAIPTHLPRVLTGMVLFVSGLTTLSYEILWFRALRYSVGNSMYALSSVLFVFLVGLGLGAMLLGRITRRQTPERDLALCQCFIAVLALGATTCQLMLLSMPGLREHISIYSSAVQAKPWMSRLFVDTIMATVVMLPATLAMGLSFPLASRLYLGDVKKLGARVGGAYLLANLGSILGAVGGAVLLLPLFGTIGGTKVAAVANLLLGILVWRWARQKSTPRLSPPVLAAIAVVVLVVALPAAMTFRGETIGDVEAKKIFVEEGDTTTVQVLAKPDKPEVRMMTIDGYAIGWGVGFEKAEFYRKQVLLAHLPMVLDPRIRHTLNVGLGSASTLHTLASYPEVESLDCVEISAAVVRASKFFEASSVFEDPRVTLIVDDALHYLLRSSKKYDAIISDGKQSPFFSGNANLLCREYYQYAMEDLTEDGILVQWIPLGTLSSDFRIILRTLCDVFPYLEVFYLPRRSVFMVGSRRPLAGRPGLSLERYRQLRTATDLAAYFIDHPTSLLSHWTGGKKQLLSLLADTPVSTWDHLLLDFCAFKATSREQGRAEVDNIRLLLSADVLPQAPEDRTFDLGSTAYRRSSMKSREACAEFLAGRVTEARMLAEQAVEANPADRVARMLTAELRKLEQTMRSRPRWPD